MPPTTRQTLSYLRSLFEQRGIVPKNKLGQNFLIDLNLIDLVVRTAEITADDLVGPLAGQPLSALVEAMVAGGTYVNVHTNDGVAPPDTGPGDFPGGEIRGQIRLVGAVPDEPMALLGVDVDSLPTSPRRRGGR